MSSAAFLDALPDEVLAHTLGLVGAKSLARAACTSRRLAALADDALTLACHELQIWPPAIDGWAASRKLRFVEARVRASAQASLVSAGHAHCARVLADGTLDVTDDGTADHHSHALHGAHDKAAPRVRAPRAAAALAPTATTTPVNGHDVVPIAAVSAGDGFTLAVTVDGEAFAWGDSSDGALGLGLARGAARVHAPSAIAALASERVVCAAAGFSHSLFVTEKGHAYSAGWAHGGRLGRGPPSARAPTAAGVDGDSAASGEAEAVAEAEHSALPRRIDSLVPAARIVGCWAGEDHSLLLDADGAAWAFGSGRDGQLGVACADPAASAHARAGEGAGALTAPAVLHEPRRVGGALAAERVVGAAAGERHSLFLSAAGRLFACGCGEEGRLGLGDARARPLPERLALRDGGAGACGEEARAVACAAGARHSAAIDEAGALWLWGELPAGWERAEADSDASWGALRVPSALASRETVVVDRPRRATALLPRGVRAAAVSCGAGYTVVLGDDGECYALGQPALDDAASEASDDAPAEEEEQDAADADDTPAEAVVVLAGLPATAASSN